MKSREQDKKFDNYYLIPIFFVVAILPLIVYLKVYPLYGASFDYWVGTRENYDFFSYYKGVWLIIAVSLGIFLYIIKLR